MNKSLLELHKKARTRMALAFSSCGASALDAPLLYLGQSEQAQWNKARKHTQCELEIQKIFYQKVA